jgi:hypothetical protein
MKKVIAVRFDGVLRPGASSITPGKVYPLLTPRNSNDSCGEILLECEQIITVRFNAESAHLSGERWTLIYEQTGTLIISNENSEYLADLTLGKEYEIDSISDDRVVFKDDAQYERDITIIYSHINFYIVINNQVINNKKYGGTRHQRA